MSQEGLSELIFDAELVCEWVEKQIGYGLGRPATAIGFARDGKLIAGVMYTNYSDEGSICAHIAGVGFWLKPLFLNAMFRYPFKQLRVRRITCYVASKNLKSRKLCGHLGFTYESTMARAMKDDDVLIYRLFKEDCRYG